MHAFNSFLFHFLALGVAGYAVVAYSVLPLGALLHPDMKTNFELHAAGIYLHIFSSVFALALGPLQFSARLRERSRRLHRWLGRLYLGVGVLLGGLSGFYMALHAFGGIPARLGFAALAVCWMATGLFAWLAVLRGDIAAHRRWMVRNLALTLAAVTLRMYLPLLTVARVPFEIAYPLVAWLCWVPNLLVSECFQAERPERVSARPAQSSGR